jgi:hypothetical protein
MKIADIIREDIEQIENPQTLRQLLADVQQEMEQVDDASMGSREGDANHAGLSQDYSALLAVENVIKNHLKALKNNLMDSNIFMYDNYDYAGEIAAIHVALEGQVAHVKWLGSYNGQGGQLYGAAMQEARRRGATSAEVEAKWNSDGFYRKMGLDTTQQGEYNPFTDSQLNKMSGQLEEETHKQLTFKVKKGRTKFATEMMVNDQSAGIYQYDSLTGRSIAEIYPEFRGQGLGKILVLHAIYTSAQLGMAFQEDESRTREYDNVIDSLSSNGYIVDDDGYWYVTGEGEQFLNSSLSSPLEEETLEELIGIKNQTRDLPRNPPRVAEYPLGLEWHKVLYNNGFRALGSGSFGTVWEHPKLSYVLKVFTADDIAYADWIATAQQHKNNPHMPRFVSPRIVRIVPGVVAIRMERLTRIDTATYNMLNMINIAVNEAIISRQSASALIASDAHYRMHNGFMTYCRDYPEFVPALDILVKFVMRPGFRPDLHDDNLMMRGPVIVLTDPVFDKKALQAHGR